MTTDEIKALLEDVTPGRWVQFHPNYCAEAKDTPFSDWDTSHDMSAILPDGARYRLATFRHAKDASACQIVPDLPDLLAQIAALQARVAELEANNANLQSLCQRYEDRLSPRNAPAKPTGDRT